MEGITMAFLFGAATDGADSCAILDIAKDMIVVSTTEEVAPYLRLKQV